MATSIKISQLPAKGSNLEATDLLEISEFNGTGYITKSITGAEIVAGATTGYVPETRTLTINGTTQDLSADRTFTVSTGITIGTTAITSGTVGRVLFEGTGNVVQESANLFWDNTNGRLGIGTSSPSVRLEAVGQVKFNASVGEVSSFQGYGADVLRIHANGNGLLEIGQNLVSPIGAPSAKATIYNRNNTYAAITINVPASQLGKGSQISWNNQGLGGGTIYHSNEVLFDMGMVNANSHYLHMFASGNVLLTNGTRTDAGYKLDVNGTARVSTTASSYASALLVENTGSAGNDNVNVATFQGNRGNASTILDNTSINIWQKNNIVNNYTLVNFLNSIGYLSAYIGAQNLSHGSGQSGNLIFGTVASGGVSTKMTIFSGGNVSIGTTTDAGFKLDINGTSIFRNTLGLVSNNPIQLAATTNGNTRILSTSNDIILNAFSTTIEHSFGTYGIRKRMMTIYGDTQSNAGVAIGVDAVNVASAILSAESTTKGFLPPRMTTTQKNAIASPATGLMVYDTTLNLISVYNGTTWITL